MWRHRKNEKKKVYEICLLPTKLGYFIENKLEKDNSFEIVDFKFNINYQERELKLAKKIANI